MLELEQVNRELMWKVAPGRCGEVNSVVRTAAGAGPVQRLHSVHGKKPGVDGASALLVAPCARTKCSRRMRGLRYASNKGLDSFGTAPVRRSV